MAHRTPAELSDVLKDAVDEMDASLQHPTTRRAYEEPNLREKMMRVRDGMLELILTLNSLPFREGSGKKT
jgi:hypothetical protein